LRRRDRWCRFTEQTPNHVQPRGRDFAIHRLPQSSIRPELSRHIQVQLIENGTGGDDFDGDLATSWSQDDI
jgi:hypothetical protein